MLKKIFSYITLCAALISSMLPSWGWAVPNALISSHEQEQFVLFQKNVLSESPEKFWDFMQNFSNSYYQEPASFDSLQSYEIEVPFKIKRSQTSLRISNGACISLKTVEVISYKDSLLNFMRQVKDLQTRIEEGFCSHFFQLLKAHYLNELNKESTVPDLDEGETTSEDSDSEIDSIFDFQEQDFLGSQLRENILHSPHYVKEEDKITFWSSLSTNKDVFFNLISELLNDPIAYSGHAAYIQSELTKGVEQDKVEYVQLKKALYFQCLWQNPTFEDYKQVLKKASNLGDAESSYRLALLYEPDLEQISAFQVPKFHQESLIKDGSENLRNSEPNCFVKANGYYEKAVEQGHLYAYDRLADFLLNQREGVSKDPQRAFNLFKEASEKGLSVAQRSLGWMYYKGDVVSQDVALAKKWYKEAIDQGLLFAKYEWGCLLLDPKNAEIYNPKEGLTYLREIQDEPTFEGEAACRRIEEYKESLKSQPQPAYRLLWSDVYSELYHHQNYQSLFDSGFHMSQTTFDVEKGELHNRFAFKDQFGIETDYLNDSIVSIREGNLIWTYHHHVFEFLRNGDLLISGQKDDTGLAEVEHLNVVNPFGRIILDKGKYAKKMCLKGRGIQLGIDAQENLLLDHLCSVVFDRAIETVDVTSDLTVQWWVNKNGEITIHKDSKVANNVGLLFLWTNNHIFNDGEISAYRFSLSSNRELKSTLFNQGIIKSCETSNSSKINIHRVQNKGIFKIQGDIQGQVDVIENTTEDSLFSVGNSQGLKIGKLENKGFVQLLGGRLQVDDFDNRGKLVAENAEIHISTYFKSDVNRSILTGKNITFSGPGELYLSGNVFVEEGFDIHTKTFFIKDLLKESLIQHLILSEGNEKTIFHNGFGWTLQHLTAKGKAQQTLVVEEDFEIGISQFDLARTLMNKGSLQTNILNGLGESKIENHGVFTVEHYIEGHFLSILQHCGDFEVKSSRDAFVEQIHNRGSFVIQSGKVKVRHIKAMDDGSSSKVKVHDLEVMKDADIHELNYLEVIGQLTSNGDLHELRLKNGVKIQSIHLVLQNLILKGPASIQRGQLTVHNHLRFNRDAQILADLNTSDVRPENHDCNQAVLTIQNVTFLPKVSTLHNVRVKGHANATEKVPSLGITNSTLESARENFLTVSQFLFQPQALHIHGRWKIAQLKSNLDHLKLYESSHLVLQNIDGANRLEHIEINESATLQFLHDGDQHIHGYAICNLGTILGRHTHLYYTSIDNRHLIYGEKKIHLETEKYKGKAAALTGESVYLYTRDETEDSLELDDQSEIGGQDTKSIRLKTQSETTLRGKILADDFVSMDIYSSSQKQNLHNYAFISSFQIYEKYKAYITELQRIRQEKGDASEEFKDQRQKYQDFLKRIAQAREAGLLSQLELVGFQNMTNHSFIASRVIEKVDNGVPGSMHVINEQQATWVAHQEKSNYESHQNGKLSRLGDGIDALTNKGIAIYGHLYNHIQTLFNEEKGYFQAFHSEVGIDTLQNMGDFSIDSGFVLLLDVREKDGRSKPVFLPEVRFRESEGDKLRTIINARIQKLVGSPQTVHTLHLERDVYIIEADLTCDDLDIWGETHIDQGDVDLSNLFIRHKFWSKSAAEIRTTHVWNSQPNSNEKTGSGYIEQLVLKNGEEDHNVEGVTIKTLKSQGNAVLSKVLLTCGAQIEHIDLSVKHLLMRGAVFVQSGQLTVQDTLRFDSDSQILADLKAKDIGLLRANRRNYR